MAKRKRKKAQKPEGKSSPSFAFKTAWFPAVGDDERPWRHLYAWLVAAFAVRAVFSLGGDFVLHPDEIMQYLEPAHRAVFGNGVIYWEYYLAGRSWLVPGFVAGILWALDQVGLGVPWVYVYVVKIAFCLVSLLVPWGVYHFARRSVGEQPARLALVICCLWPYIAIFSHKPFTEFVATSLFFGALGLASVPSSRKLSGAIAFGAVLALASAVRVQYLPICGILWLARCMGANLRWTLASVAGGVAVLALVGVVETITWGIPFRSYYVNIVINNALDEFRSAQEWHFFFGRLLFITAGGIAVAVWAIVMQPRKHALVAAIILVTLALHMMQTHKELRFVYVVSVIWAIPFCGLVHAWTQKLSDAHRTRAFAAASAAFLAIAGSNLLPDQWLHIAHSSERGQVRYLFGQTNMFEKYLEIARKEDVKGVIHVGDQYFNTPGYYYLHHDVPFYDNFVLEDAFRSGEITNVNEAASHMVSLSKVVPPPGFVPVNVDEIGEYLSYFNPDVGTVRQWESNTPTQIGDGMFALGRKHLGVTEQQMPPVVRFKSQSN